jgi:hypothetical protein
LKTFLLTLLLTPVLCFAGSPEHDLLNEQTREISRAQLEVNQLYNYLLSALDRRGKTEEAETLAKTEAAFESGKLAEAIRKAKEGGAVGGSALAEDTNTALLAILQEHRSELERELLVLGVRKNQYQH